jgi:transposase InsO family protein
VKPSTVIGWHRAGFRLFWKWKSRKCAGKRTRAEIIAAIRKVATENPTWGAPRIHGELLKLGLCLSERTVSRFIPKRSYKGDDLSKRRQNWRAFLHNHKHVISAMDFMVVPTWNFQQLYILVILDHGRRIVRHFNVTANPTADWVKQQLREAFPFDEIPRYLIHDRDQTFRPMKAFLEALGIEPKRTAYHCPWQNGFVERVNLSLRRDLLDHIIPLNEDHLRRLLQEYLRYYHEDRTHLGLSKDSPKGRRVEPKPSEGSVMKAMPRCGGLHHRYTWTQDPHQRERWSREQAA